MTSWFSRESRRTRILVPVVVLALLVILVARGHPARPQVAAAYHGTAYLRGRADRATQLPIAFDVSDHGAEVENLRFPDGLPHACADVGVSRLGQVAQTGPEASILASGRFSASLAIRQGSARIGTLSVDGTFGSGGHASGVLSSVFSAPDRRGCDARAVYVATSGSAVL